MSPPYLLRLDALVAADASLVGGKAFNLGRMIQAGFPCPAGLVLSTAAYRAFVARHQLVPLIAAALGDCDATNPRSLNRASEAIAGAFQRHEIALDLTTELGAALPEFGLATLAVRSSGSSEDLPLFSFAGQHDSVLDVSGIAELHGAIKRCWASMFSARAIQYRSRAGIDSASCAMAVILQPMVAADAAGVGFTADPSRPERTQIIINAARGLGEGVVAGSVAPDTYVVERSALERQDALVFSSDQSRSRPAVLDAALIRATAEIALRAERLFGKPQDIEWAVLGERVHILQSRDITTGVPSVEVRHGLLDRLFLDFFYDYFPRPMQAFDTSAMESLVDHTLGLATDFGLRPARFAEVLTKHQDGSYAIVPVRPRLRLMTLPCLVPHVVRALLSLRTSPDLWVDELQPRLEQKLAGIERIDLATLADQDVIQHCRQAMAVRDSGVFLARRPYFWGGWLVLSTFPVLLRRLAGDDTPRLQRALLGNVDHPTRRMNGQIAAIAERAAAVGARVVAVPHRDAQGRTVARLSSEPANVELNGLLARLMSEFGGRSNELIPMPSMPAWENDPASLLTLLNGLIDKQHCVVAPDAISNQDAVALLEQHAGRSPWRLVGVATLVRRQLPRVRAMVRERDGIIHGYDLVSRHIRFAMLELGNRLAERGILDRAGDVRFLRLGDIEAVFTAKLTTAQAKALVQRRQFARPRTTWLWRRPSRPRKVSSTAGVVLTGLAASPGRHQGVARLVRSSEDFDRVEPGDILVCQATTPGWTPLFAIAGAVVADLGGALSHAAIVAREYGIPAVLNTSAATTTLKDGERYLVDGDLGLVREVSRA